MCKLRSQREERKLTPGDAMRFLVYGFLLWMLYSTQQYLDVWKPGSNLKMIMTQAVMIYVTVAYLLGKPIGNWLNKRWEGKTDLASQIFQILEKWFPIDLMLIFLGIVVASGGFLYHIKSQNLTMTTYTLERDASYERRFGLKNALVIQEINTGTDIPEDVVRIAAEWLCEWADYPLASYDEVTVDEIHIYYEDEKKIVAELKVTAEDAKVRNTAGQAWNHTEKTIRAQEMVLLIRTALGRWKIQQTGDEIQTMVRLERS